MARNWPWKAGRKGKGRPAGNPVEPVSLWVQAGGVALPADLTLPGDSAGLILFAHGSGSSRHSPRNRQVARFLNQAGFSTLLLDLLTREEEEVDQETTEYRFDIELLAERLMGATRWALADSRLSNLKEGYFGASTPGRLPP